jgi:hypothetical protein
VTIVRSIRTRRPSTDIGVLAPTARASGHRDRDRAEERRRNGGDQARAARICFRIPRIKRRRCTRLGSSSCGRSGDIGTTSGERQGMIGGVQPQSSERLGDPARGGVGGAVLGAGALVGGWVGPEATAARPSRAQAVRISTFCSSSRGRRRLSTTPRWGRAAVHPAAANARCGSELSAQALRASALRGLAEIAHCGDEYGSRLCGVVAGRERRRRSGRLQIWPKGSATQRSGSAASRCSTPAATTQCRRVAPRLRCWRRVPRCPATRVVLGADLAVQLRRLRFQDLGDLNERYPARVGQIEGPAVAHRACARQPRRTEPRAPVEWRAGSAPRSGPPERLG